MSGSVTNYSDENLGRMKKANSVKVRFHISVESTVCIPANLLISISVGTFDGIQRMLKSQD